jgi:hypothetical protein
MREKGIYPYREISLSVCVLDIQPNNIHGIVQLFKILLYRSNIFLIAAERTQTVPHTIILPLQHQTYKKDVVPVVPSALMVAQGEHRRQVLSASERGEFRENVLWRGPGDEKEINLSALGHPVRFLENITARSIS